MMTTNLPLSITSARRVSLLCKSGPIYFVRFYLITRHNSLIITGFCLRCLHTSNFLEAPYLEGLPTKAKDDSSPHETRLSPAGHQLIISWSQGIIVVVVVIIIIIIIIVVIIINYYIISIHILSLQARLLPFRVFSIFQSLSSSVGTFPSFPFFLRQLVRNISDYLLSLFLDNYNNVWCSYLYHVFTQNIGVPKHFYFFIFYCSFWDVFIPFFCVLTISSYNGPNRLSLLHCCVVFFIFSEPISHIHLLSVAYFTFFPT